MISQYKRLSICILTAIIISVGTVSADSSDWVATWSTSPSNPPTVPQALKGFENQTLRQIVHISLGGDQVRVRISNEDGTAPLEIGAAHIAIRDQNSAIVPSSDRVLTFGGSPTITIPAGAPILSDPVNLEVAPLSDLAISLYLPSKTGSPTHHMTALQKNYVSKEGNFAGSTALESPKINRNWNFITAVDVYNSDAIGVIVAVGDSITDGYLSTSDSNRRWPDYLARRLAAHSRLKNLAIVNAGIGGNRVLNDTPKAMPGFGLNLLSRLEQDVLSMTGITHVVLLEGINDIGASAQVTKDQDVTAAEIIQGYRQVIARGRARGLKVFGATLPPFKGAGYYTDKGEAKRLTINEWVRTAGEYDGWFDFDAATRNPDDHSKMRSDFTKDNLHPNDAGYEAMANIIDLSLFE